MPPLMHFARRLAAATTCVLAATCARAELLKVSPFLGPQTAANPATQNAPLEYRGSMAIGDVVEFRVVDPARKVGTWLKVGEHDANLDVSLKEHNDTQDTITLDHGGQTMTLQLKTAKVVSSGAMPPPIMPVAPPSPNVSPAVIQTVVPNPTPQQEQERLQAVAAEVARRRALREQAMLQAQAQAQGVPPQPSPPPQVNPSRADMIQAQQFLQQQHQQRR
jgi:hypothetical protein